MRLPILHIWCRLLWQSITSPRPVSPLKPRFFSLRLLVFPKAKIAVEREEICECDGHTIHKLSQRRLTANWLVPRQRDCSRMGSKVSFDWVPSYIKAKRPVLEIFKMAGYFTDSLLNTSYIKNMSWLPFTIDCNHSSSCCKLYQRIPRTFWSYYYLTPKRPDKFWCPFSLHFNG
jgi:hypothetical protein